MTNINTIIQVAVLIAVHNRKEKTLACLRTLKNSLDYSNKYKIELTLYVFDDGSSDGTSKEVKKLWPSARIIQGDGSYFWCRGMNVVWVEAAAEDPDYYLLLNDDTNLLDGFLEKLLKTSGGPAERTIGVGLIIDPDSGVKSYGGSYLKKDINENSVYKECSLFNANCILIPRAVYQEIGIFHTAYTHAFGDTDYSHKARRHGIRILETDKPVGTCARNSINGTWKDCSLGKIQRLKKLNSIKGLPYKEWFLFCRRNCGYKWMYYFIAPTIRILMGK